jgi:hypothetical protein
MAAKNLSNWMCRYCLATGYARGEGNIFGLQLFSGYERRLPLEIYRLPWYRIILEGETYVYLF